MQRLKTGGKLIFYQISNEFVNPLFDEICCNKHFLFSENKYFWNLITLIPFLYGFNWYSEIEIISFETLHSKYVSVTFEIKINIIIWRNENYIIFLCYYTILYCITLLYYIFNYIIHWLYQKIPQTLEGSWKEVFPFFFFTKQEGICDASQQLQCNFLVVLLH